MPFTVTTKGRLGISRKKDFQAVIKAGAMGVEGGGQSSGRAEVEEEKEGPGYWSNQQRPQGVILNSSITVKQQEPLNSVRLRNII